MSPTSNDKEKELKIFYEDVNEALNKNNTYNYYDGIKIKGTHNIRREVLLNYVYFMNTQCQTPRYCRKRPSNDERKEREMRKNKTTHHPLNKIYNLLQVAYKISQKIIIKISLQERTNNRRKYLLETETNKKKTLSN